MPRCNWKAQWITSAQRNFDEKIYVKQFGMMVFMMVGLAGCGGGGSDSASTETTTTTPIAADTIITVAGGRTAGLGDNGVATNAELIGPAGVAVDANGNL